MLGWLGVAWAVLCWGARRGRGRGIPPLLLCRQVMYKSGNARRTIAAARSSPRKQPVTSLSSSLLVLCDSHGPNGMFRCLAASPSRVIYRLQQSALPGWDGMVAWAFSPFKPDGSSRRSLFHAFILRDSVLGTPISSPPLHDEPGTVYRSVGRRSFPASPLFPPSLPPSLPPHRACTCAWPACPS